MGPDKAFFRAFVKNSEIKSPQKSDFFENAKAQLVWTPSASTLPVFWFGPLHQKHPYLPRYFIFSEILLPIRVDRKTSPHLINPARATEILSASSALRALVCFYSSFCIIASFTWLRRSSQFIFMFLAIAESPFTCSAQSAGRLAPLPTQGSRTRVLREATCLLIMQG